MLPNSSSSLEYVPPFTTSSVRVPVAHMPLRSVHRPSAPITAHSLRRLGAVHLYPPGVGVTSYHTLHADTYPPFRNSVRSFVRPYHVFLLEVRATSFSVCNPVAAHVPSFQRAPPPASHPEPGPAVHMPPRSVSRLIPCLVSLPYTSHSQECAASLRSHCEPAHHPPPRRACYSILRVLSRCRKRLPPWSARHLLPRPTCAASTHTCPLPLRARPHPARPDSISVWLRSNTHFVAPLSHLFASSAYASPLPFTSLSFPPSTAPRVA